MIPGGHFLSQHIGYMTTIQLEYINTYRHHLWESKLNDGGSIKWVGVILLEFNLFWNHGAMLINANQGTQIKVNLMGCVGPGLKQGVC